MSHEYIVELTWSNLPSPRRAHVVWPAGAGPCFSLPSRTSRLHSQLHMAAKLSSALLASSIVVWCHPYASGPAFSPSTLRASPTPTSAFACRYRAFTMPQLACRTATIRANGK
ncbi:unnamed protein product [Protopolystoma xenopodis]|uniref:Uncharacterized protein n=1 Tax=Protopolystoma xenopodis TaxID=117903 RepID=A0A448XS25_9PLAT|nr:unnamed protein product [Protopolystoma xenopodis]